MLNIITLLSSKGTKFKIVIVQLGLIISCILVQRIIWKNNETGAPTGIRHTYNLYCKSVNPLI